MVDTKINDLTLAEDVLTSMQLETDIAGSTANKITLAQLRAFIIAAVNAAVVGVVNTDFQVLTGENAQTLWEQNDVALLNARTTGIRYGGRVSVTNGLGTSKTVDITAGAGQILDNTDAENPTYTNVSWTAKSAVSLDTESPNVTYFYLDDNTDTIKQTTAEPTNADYRTRIYLARTSFTASLNVITGIAAIAVPVQQEGVSIRDLAEAIGPIRSQGLIAGPSGANLNLLISAGGIFAYGSNYEASYVDPNVVSYDTFDTGDTDIFRYVIPGGVIGVNQTNIQVANYAPAGVVTPIPGANTRVGLHFIFRFGGAAGNVRISYGDSFYTNISDAVDALQSIDPLTLVPESFENAFLIAAIAVEKSETNLNNATFIKTNSFGEF